MCIKCGYYFKDYDHSVELSDDLTGSILGTNQNLANFLTKGLNTEDEGDLDEIDDGEITNDYKKTWILWHLLLLQRLILKS